MRERKKERERKRKKIWGRKRKCERRKMTRAEIKKPTRRALSTCTTTILNSSEISDMKVEICFMSRSTEDSFPVLSSVVMAKVAMDRFTSVIRFSKSKLQAVTAAG